MSQDCLLAGPQLLTTTLYLLSNLQKLGQWAKGNRMEFNWNTWPNMSVKTTATIAVARMQAENEQGVP